MSNKVYPVPHAAEARALVNNDQYEAMYKDSVENNEAFWAEHGKRLDWIKPYSKVKDVSFAKEDLHIRWYEDGSLNASVNCIDRHLATRGEQTAIIWEGDDPSEAKEVSYNELSQEVNKLANALKEMGVKKGDRVTLYMPMLLEATYAMLACARIGAVHSIVFGGFSPEALAGRIVGCDSKLVITSDYGLRGTKQIPLKKNVDLALEHPSVEDDVQVLVVKRTGGDINWVEGRDTWYNEIVEKQSDECAPEEMNAEDPLFILYTSGSTGQPKGVLHTTGGYLVYASMTHEYIFDYQDGDIYWCTADVGWITGHSYIVYGPLANGATTVMFEGVPNYPGVNRMAQIVDKWNVNVLYTAPTAIRMLMAEGDKATEGCSLDSLRLLGSVGEPINPEAWNWYYENFGKEECPIVDTWWQTETGGILISPLPGATALKPGSATRPFFGVMPELLDAEGNLLEGENAGSLVIADSWPGQMRSVYGDHQRFIDTYFATYEGKYFTSDGAKRDADGYYWITGRVDDVLNVSGHRLGTAELESALVAHKAIAEAAVVGYPHNIKGEGIYVYVTPMPGVIPTDELTKEIVMHIRKEIGPIASPDLIQWTQGLPKTRSGKIMRRILRKIAANEQDQLGDTSTLADPSVVDELIENRLNM
jgi:acetyl-CoA synthetase